MPEQALKKALEQQAICSFFPPPEEKATSKYKRERAEQLQKRHDTFVSFLKETRYYNNESNKKFLLAGLQFHLANQKELDTPQALEVSPDYLKLCKALASGTSDEEKDIIIRFYQESRLAVAERILVESNSEQATSLPRAHRQRRHALESCLRILADVEQGVDAGESKFIQRIHRARACALLYRGRIIREKGFSIPGKKKAALLQAYEFCREPGCFDDKDIEHCRLKAMIYLELIRIGALPDGADEGDFFATAALLVYDNLAFIPEATIDSEILLYYAELTKDNTLLHRINDNSDRVFPVVAARAAWLRNILGKKQIISSAIESTRHYPFSHPCWRDLTDLIRVAKAQDQDWSGLAVQLWRNCRAKERLTTHNCQLRWYWSHQLDLYDLAFHAALSQNKIELAAEVADSLKGRTAVHRQVLEELGADDETIREYLEAESIGYNGGFVFGGTESSYPPPGEENAKPFSELPGDQWLAVHFYISNGATPGTTKNQGYALIYDKEKEKDDPWEVKDFSAETIWDAYRLWLKAYLQPPRGMAGSARQLVVLATFIGQEMKFLFKIKAERPVVFVPYGFLHRLPLHMAIQEDKTGTRIWATEHPSCFLPNWSSQKSCEPAKGRRVLLQHFPGPFSYPLLKNGTPSWDVMDDKASAQQLVEIRTPLIPPALPPSHLAILTHGVAHPINPFASALMFNEAPLTLHEFLAAPQEKMDLSGSLVFIGACEADMMVPQGALADEHLSFAGAFLQKGAGQVISGLYQVVAIYLQNCCVATLTGRPPQEFCAWQQQNIQTQVVPQTNGDKFAEMFFYTAAFRLLGLPMRCQLATATIESSEE